MAHWAELDENNVVLRVLVGDNDDPNGDEGHQWLLDNLGGTWVQTSYNGTIRKNFAGIGYTYREDLDAFVPPRPLGPSLYNEELGSFVPAMPLESWLLNEETALWEAPIPYPTDGLTYQWDEEAGDWAAVDFRDE
jgi:hypothetical protein